MWDEIQDMPGEIFDVNPKLEMLSAREQLMEDIDAICDEFFCEHFPNSQEQFDDLVRVLCDAVCRNFPSNWHKLMNNNAKSWTNDLSTLVERYAEQLMDSMDMKTMEQFVFDTLVENLTNYTEDELITEISDYYPELLEE